MPHKLSFRVLHATSTDSGYSTKELEIHNPLVKGWQSIKFCPYPQEIILKLPKKTRMKKLQLLAHQFLIPTKIEVYLGSYPPEHVVSLHGTRYKRLGYVTMSDNEKTSFKARELKSVHIDAVGQYLRLVLHKNYINKFNLYNQVGVIAINVLGDEVDDEGNVIPDDKQQRVNELINRYMPNGQAYPGEEEPTTQNPIDPSVLGAMNNPDFISPMDDLAFDMYQDPEVAQIIRKLDVRKNEAVLQEEYDVAKRLKQAIVDLQKVGERIGRFEVEKRRAIETEDYDLAKVKKIQMDEYRLQIYKQLELHDLLESSKFLFWPPKDSENTPSDVPKERSPRRERNPEERSPRNARLREKDTVDVSGRAEDRPLPTLKNSPRDQPDPIHGSPRSPEPEVTREEIEQEEKQEETTGTSELPPGVTSDVLREASGAIDTFGEQTVFKIFAKNWSLRKEGLNEVRSHLDGVEERDKELLRNILRATVFLIVKLLKDKVIAVFTATLDLISYTIADWLVKHKMTKNDTSYVVENVLPELMGRIGDTNARLKGAAVDYIVEFAGLREVRHLHTVPGQCTIPFKSNSQAKMAVTKVDIVIRLVQDLGVDNNSGLTVDNVMTFAMKAVQHTAGEVRDAGLQLICELYKVNGPEVKSRLPNEEDPKVLKNPLYVKIFNGLNKIDGKPTRQEQQALTKKGKLAREKAKKEEIEGLEQQLADLKAATQAAEAAKKRNKEGGSLNTNSNGNQSKTPRAISPGVKGKTKIPTRTPSIAEQSEAGEDDQCVFCGDKNEAYRDGGMDVHYWKQCPMLKKCPKCKQVVEVSGQTEHLLTECESRTKFAKCPRCSEAHEKTELDRYVTEKICEPLAEGMARCPLCETQIPANDESWKSHLMGPNGCPLNPRKGGKKSKLPVKDKKGSGAAGKQVPRQTRGKKGVKGR
ncbi:centrosomal protein of 104 kDa-like isoform X1 [Apostichopus japonicus]|uniref:centrosomal protein of 104 kDa-like isoform X1 n=1 Tax=Stichopus japonicus TaxID=307972 RepID=UPI003AB6F362